MSSPSEPNPNPGRSVAELGRRIYRHGLATDQLVFGMFMIGALGLLGGVGLVKGILRLYVFDPDPENPSDGWGAIMVAGGILFALAFGLLIKFWLESRLRVEVFEGGLIILNLTRRNAMAWADISEVVQEGPAYGGMTDFRFGSLTIRTRDRKTFQVARSIENYRELEAFVLASVHAAMLPTARQRIVKGEELTFGSLAISKQGIRAGDKLLRWADYGNTYRSGNDLSVATVTEKYWCTLPTTAVPNLSVFLELAHWLKGDD